MAERGREDQSEGENKLNQGESEPRWYGCLDLLEEQQIRLRLEHLIDRDLLDERVGAVPPHPGVLLLFPLVVRVRVSRRVRPVRR